MRKIREVLRLRADGFSEREIARSVGCARSSVQICLWRADKAGVSWPLSPDQDEATLEALLYPRRSPGVEVHPTPDFEWVERELKRKHVTRRQLWREYLAQYPDGLKYTAFCVKFQAWRASRAVTLALVHTPGDQLFVDHAGDPVSFTDRTTGLEQKAWLFVAVWPYSAKLYVEATRTQTSADWLAAHVRALEAFGCAPRALVPDNCSTAVKKALRYDPQFNRSYAELAEHYSLAVLPARVRKPRDKAAVENGVLQAERAVLGGLRNAKFFSLAELNTAIHQRVAAINAEPFQKRDGSRDSVFEAEEKPVARPLPARRYDYADWKIGARVHQDHHVEVARAYYSVHYTLIRQRVDVRLGALVAYLAGHNHPVHEVLFPKQLPLEPAFTNEFACMTRDAVQLTALDQTQARLLTELPRALSESHRDFLLPLVSAEPAWELMPFAHLEHLPALQWKLLNLRKLKARDPIRFQTQHDELAGHLKELPSRRRND